MTPFTARRLFLTALLIAAAAAPQPGVASPSDIQTLDTSTLFYKGLYQEIGKGDLEAALATYREIAGNPATKSDIAGEALIREGICLEKLGRGEEALACYNKAVERSPGSAAILEKALSEMVVYFSRPAVVMVKGRELETLVAEGKKSLDTGAPEEARQKFQNALLIDPDNPDLQVRMAAVCTKLGRYKDAALYYTLAMKSQEYMKNRQLQRALAECYENAGEYDSAISLWRSYLESVPSGSQECKMAQREMELLFEARDRPATMAIPWDLTIQLSYAEEQTRKGRYRDAASRYRKAQASFPGNYIPTFMLGLLYDYLYPGKDNVQNAMSCYVDALKSAPPLTAQRLRFRLAQLYEQGGELDKASYYIEQYFSKDIRPVQNDHVLKERIRKKRMWERVHRIKQES